MLATAADVVVVIIVVPAVTVAVVIVPVAVVVLAFVLHCPLVPLLCRLVVACCIDSGTGIFAPHPYFG
jgi:hypothetical protein